MSWHIFTRGPLFEAVQALRLFPDSKKFPDMIPRASNINNAQLNNAQLEAILEKFNEIWSEHLFKRVSEFTTSLGVKKPALERFKSVAGFGNGIIAFRSELYNLIDKYFQDRPEPVAMLDQSVLRAMSSMEAYIDSTWPVLKQDNRNEKTEGTTLIKLYHPYVVAGLGRFNEVYYWDAYFTGEGLVLSGYLDLFDFMVKNYAAQICEYKYVPNGNREYYLGRSQPPFYCSMIDLLARMKGIAFLENHCIEFTDKDNKKMSIKYIDMAEEEYRLFWMNEEKYQDPRGEDAKTKSTLKWWGRVVKFKEDNSKEDIVVLNKYWDDSYDKAIEPHVQPRTEAYYEDISAFARTLYDTEAASDFFLNIRATAESGWDFSSRWFQLAPERGGEVKRERNSIRTGNILPVDLNALLFGMEKKLFEWTRKNEYKDALQRRKKAMIDYFWTDELGWFFDCCLGANKEDKPVKTDVWSLAGAYPLFTKLFDDENTKDMERVNKMADTICKYFLKAGGVVTTLHATSEQWDYPNGWAPLQWIVVRGLLNYREHLEDKHRNLALEIAKRFVACVGSTYKRTGRIMEKYNVCETAVTASGGEYEVQHGFGWTNGVIKAFMSEFRSDMKSDSDLRDYLE